MLVLVLVLMLVVGCCCCYTLTGATANVSMVVSREKFLLLLPVMLVLFL